MTGQRKKWLVRSAAVLVIGVLAVLAWQRYGRDERDGGLTASNQAIADSRVGGGASLVPTVMAAMVR